MATEEVAHEIMDRFTPASPNSDWYENLKRSGSCLKLHELLGNDPQLLHQTGQEGVTALHKGVFHGCVKLVRHILVDMFDDESNCQCRLNGPLSPCLTREELLRKTSSDGVTAVQMAVVSGSPKMVVLLRWAIDMSTYKEECRRLAGHDVPAQESSEGLFCMRYFSESERESLEGRLMGHQVEANNMRNTEVGGEDAPSAPEVPGVTDAGIDGIYGGEEEELRKDVYAVIKGELENPAANEVEIATLKEECGRDVDFEFSEVEHVFLHFLVSGNGQYSCYYLERNQEQGLRFGMPFWIEILKQFIDACNRRDQEKKDGAGRMGILFNLHDSQGRTLFHVLLDAVGGRERIFGIWQILQYVERSTSVSARTYANCCNARDSAGRTFLHSISILDDMILDLVTHPQMVDMDAKVLPVNCPDLKILLGWCFPDQFGDWCDPGEFYCTPIHLQVLFNSTKIFKYLTLQIKGIAIAGFWYKIMFDKLDVLTPLQIAAYLGRASFVEDILQHHTKYNSTRDIGLGDYPHRISSAISCAALSGQVEAIQIILKFPVYDPIVEDPYRGTALHVAVKQSNSKLNALKRLQVLALMHALPTSGPYKRIREDFAKCEVQQVVPRMYSANEKTCINLLLQAGLDIWTPHPRTKEFPTPGPVANDEANIWWYDKVVKEVVDAKTSISYAANATSVVAALVATASFIGPFQPPLGYDSTDGYVQADRSPVRVYLVCNSLSFFFSVASILMALLPAIPMPKESLYDELRRSQRCLKASALMLLIAIMCVLISFSSASIAVVSSDWRERELVVACIICGGAVCMVVLVVYVIRLLRMVFHRNAGIRRRFAKYMWF